MATHQPPPPLHPEIEQIDIKKPGRGEHGYYRRKDGWIVTAPTWDSFRADLEYKGCTYLPEYGQFLLGTPWGETSKDNRGQGYNAAQEPWKMIFQRGGAKEFPISQIIAYRWHINSPYADVQFAQMEGINVTDLACPECSSLFSHQDEDEAMDMLRRHLTSGINSRHTYNMADLLALGEEWDIDFGVKRIGKRAVRRNKTKAKSAA